MPATKASITAHEGPFVFGQTYHRDDLVAAWTPAKGGNIDGYFARVEVRDAGVVVGVGYLSLSHDHQVNITLGPAPSWPAGDAYGSLVLVAFSNGIPKDVASSASFVVDDPADIDGPA